MWQTVLWRTVLWQIFSNFFDQKKKTKPEHIDQGKVNFILNFKQKKYFNENTIRYYYVIWDVRPFKILYLKRKFDWIINYKDTLTSVMVGQFLQKDVE